MTTTTPENTPFQDAMTRAWESLTTKERAEFPKTQSIDDVLRETDRIQREQGKSGLLRNLNRIEPYLQWLKQYSPVIEVFVQFKPQILALIWGPIKFLLQIASNYTQSYEAVLEVMSDISQCLPQFQQVEVILQDDSQVKNILCLFYREIIEFHIEAIRFFRIKGWRTFFQMLWPQFKEKFAVILRNLNSHKDLIDRQITVALIRGAYADREERVAEHARTRRFQELQEFETLERALQPPLYDQELEEVKTSILPGTGIWLFTDQLFQRWVDHNSIDLAKRVLWISGIPGSGKTYMASRIIHHLESSTEGHPSTLLFVLLRHDSAHKRTAVNVLHSLIYQLVLDNRTFLPILLTAYMSQARKFRTDTQYLGTMLQNLIDNIGRTYVVVDGLDECDEVQRGLLLNILVEISEKCSNMRLAISSRDELDISRALKSISGRTIVNKGNELDIEAYVLTRLSDLSREVQIHSSIKGVDQKIRALLTPITARAKGMFLYAKLVLDHLRSLTTWKEIQEEAMNLPAGLHQAYGRILERIKVKLGDRERDQTRRILAWLVCAERQMTVAEINDALTIQRGDRFLDQTQRLHWDMVQLCGPFVEKRNGFLVFVHFSAKEYLINQDQSVITLLDAHIIVASACLSYLCFACFDDDATDDYIETCILRGEYVFQEYAYSKWLYHVREAVGGPRDAVKEMNLLVRGFIQARWRSTYTSVKSGQDHSFPDLYILKDEWPDVYEALCVLLVFSLRQSSAGGYSENPRDPLVLGIISRRIHCHFDALAQSLCAAPSHPACSSLHTFYGGLFRCHIDTCPHYYNGFDTESAREKHVSKHERPLKCQYPTCDFHCLGFGTELERKEHYTKVHSKGPTAASFDSSLETIDEHQCRGMLHSAAQSGDLDLFVNVSALCDRKKVVWRNLDTLFEAAGKGGSEEIFIHLIHQYPSCQTRPYVWSSAVANDLDGVVDFLLESGVFYSGQNWDGRSRITAVYSPVHAAVEAGSERNLLRLLDAGADIEESGLLKGGACAKPLHRAVLAANLPLLEVLLRHSARVDSRTGAGNTALHLAAQIGSEVIVQLLIEHGADVGARGFLGETPLGAAARKGSEAVVRLLLKHLDGTTSESGSRPALHLAVREVRASKVVIQLLIDSGMTLDSKTTNGDTPLHWAAQWGTEEIVEFLISKGADPHATTEHGWTILRAALQRPGSKGGRVRQSRIVQLLSKRAYAEMKASALQKLTQGDFDRSSGKHFIEIEPDARLALATTLISSGTDVNAKDAKGKTALFLGAVTASEPLVQRLLGVGADPTSVDNMGNTIFHHLAHEVRNFKQIYGPHRRPPLKRVNASVELLAEAVLSSNRKQSFDFAGALEALKAAQLPIPNCFLQIFEEIQGGHKIERSDPYHRIPSR